MNVLAPSLLALIAISNGCVVPPDSHSKPNPPVIGGVFHWTVADSTNGAEIAKGCGKEVNERAAQIKFAAAVGATVVETVVYEEVEKNPSSPQNAPGAFPTRESEDKYWCSTQDDVWRHNSNFSRGNIECAQLSTQFPPVASILSREVIPMTDGMGGYRLMLKVLGPGMLAYQQDGACPFGLSTELTVLRPQRSSAPALP